MAGFNWSSLKLQFDERHDFESEDFSNLKKRFPHCKFTNVPEAWIIIIDEMLCSMREPGTIREIRQEYGQLIIEFRDGFNLPDNRKHIEEAESKIYRLDKDINNDRQASLGDTDKKNIN